MPFVTSEWTKTMDIENPLLVPSENDGLKSSEGKKKAPKKVKKVPLKPEPLMNNNLLDLLFLFVGVFVLLMPLVICWLRARKVGWMSAAASTASCTWFASQKRQGSVVRGEKDVARRSTRKAADE